MAKIGLKNFFYGILSEASDGTPSYGVKKKLAKAVQCTVNITNNDAKLFADDGLAESDTTFQSGTISLTIDDVDDTVMADLLGHDIEGGVMVRSAQDIAPYVGFGRIITKLVGGVYKYKVEFLYKCKFSERDTLVAECDENYEEIRSVKSLDRAKVKISAYDLSAFYKKHDFRIGDGIIVKVIDWECGKFSLEYCPAAKLPQEEDKEKFLTGFEDGIAETFKIFGEYQPPCDQIAYAYFFASGRLAAATD